MNKRIIKTIYSDPHLTTEHWSSKHPNMERAMENLAICIDFHLQWDYVWCLGDSCMMKKGNETVEFQIMEDL